MPVAVSPIDREMETGGFEFRFEGGDQVAALAVDGADAIEVVIVFGDFEQALAGDVAAAEDVFEERDDILALFRAAEGNEEKGVVISRHQTFSSCASSRARSRSWAMRDDFVSMERN